MYTTKRVSVAATAAAFLGLGLVSPQVAADIPCGEPVEDDAPELYPMPDDDKWGYVDADGEWAIEPQWSRVKDFHEGRAIVETVPARDPENRMRSSGRWTVIDTEGEPILESAIDARGSSGSGEDIVGTRSISDYSEGCAVIEGSSDHHWIDRDGEKWQVADISEELAETDIDEVGRFSEGRARVRIEIETDGNFPDRKNGWINADGEVVIEPQFEDAGLFAEGKAPVATDRREWTYVDEAGEFVFPDMELQRASSFSAGWASVTSPRGADISRGHIDHEGEFMNLDSLGADGESRPSVSRLGSFNDGLAQVHVGDGGRVEGPVYIDPDGELAFELSEKIDTELCNRAPGFHQGRIRLLVARDAEAGCGEENFGAEHADYETARYVYLDTDGDVVLEQE